MAENVPESTYFPHDREQLLNTIARFDDGLRVEDVLGPENGADNFRQNSNTVLIQVLLEFIFHAFVKDENQREILLMEACKRLSNHKILNNLLIMDKNNALRRIMKHKVINFLKKVCEKIIPAPELDSSAVDLFENNCLSTDLKLFYHANFIELDKIGEGAFGSVYKVQYKLNKLIYAVKKISFVYKTDRNFLMVMREANNFAALSHPNIVCYYSAWIEMSESGAANELPSDANLSPDLPDCETARNHNGLVIKENMPPPGGNSDSLSENDSDEKCYENSESAGSADSIVFSESAEVTKVPNWNVKNYSQKSYFNEDDKYDFDSEDDKDDSDSEDGKDDSDSEDSKDDSDSEDNKDDSGNEDIPFSNLKIQGILYIQMEYCDCDLSVWLTKRAVMKGKELPFQMDVSEIFTNIVKGVAHIHSRNIIHRDLKPHNIFYSRSSNTVKIGDFGLATLVGFTDSSNVRPHRLSSVVGTKPYSAPEQILNNYDMKVDIYSLGVILIELINVCVTHCELSYIIEAMKKGEIVEGSKKFPVLAKLANILISDDPKQRMTAKEILDYMDRDRKIILKEVVVNEFSEKIKEKEETIKGLQETIKLLDERVQNMEVAIDQQSLRLNKIFSELNINSE